ncbi:hypothetical protein JCGZ_19477 [Jatropha curcas]|uniref:Uncharacterized protein n=1 Tax=Jatropha curcas TaxID=180498 RepID=A0A067K8C3_JATCU|nr:hypothetical protein JCGZ_19477 [Jatropha curcas]
MGESVQDQLTKLFNLLLSEQQANQTYNEKVEQLHAKLDAMSFDLESIKKGLTSSIAESPAPKAKGPIGSACLESPRGTTTVSKFTELEVLGPPMRSNNLGKLAKLEHPKTAAERIVFQQMFQVSIVVCIEDRAEQKKEIIKHQLLAQLGGLACDLAASKWEGSGKKQFENDIEETLEEPFDPGILIKYRSTINSSLFAE